MSSRNDITEKKRIRERILALRESLSPQVVQEAGRRIAEMILEDPAARGAKVVCSYASMGKEIPTGKLMDRFRGEGKIIVIPDWEGWKEGSGMRVAAVGSERDLLTENRLVPQPVVTSDNIVPIGEVDLFLVPGVAFDGFGNRIGMGGGFFDRLLFLASSKATFYGLAYGFQVLGRLPFEPHDVPVHRVFSF